MTTQRVTRSALRWIAAAAMSTCLATAALPSKADDLGDVQRLLGAGQADAAMARADKHLLDNPGDPQMRFMKGVMLTDAKRGEEATAIFLRLTEDHPDLVEPYNNLAALYAAGGDYAKARSTLEQALRTNPGYATAHENLGDVYVALAAQSYARALQLAPGITSPAPKLALMRRLLEPQGMAEAAPAPAPAPPSAAASAVAPR